MFILHVLDHHHRYNGMVHAAVDLACAQAAAGHQVAVCSSVGSFASLFAEHKVQFFELHALSGRFSAIQAIVGLWSVTGKFKPDVIHAHMTKSALIAYAVSRLRGVPLVTCVQNSFSKFAPLMKVGDLVITGCQAVADDMEKRGVPRTKLRPILNGTIGSVRQPPFHSDQPQPSFKHPAIVTFCGMHWRKGVPDLIAGFQAARLTLPDLNLYLYGEGPGLLDFRKLINAENTGNITFCEPVPNAKPYLQAADAFVLASLADPAPLIIAEAREAGLAIIATRVDGIPELLEDGRAGILVEPNAPDQIAEKIVYLFSDPSHLETWRKNSQISVDRLTVYRVADQSVEVYRELTEGRTREQATMYAAE